MHKGLDRSLHQLYLNNYFLASASFDIEKLLYGKVNAIEQSLLITGLARSGTTALLNHFHALDQFASLTYKDMPFLLMPNIWGKHNKKRTEKQPRFHNDNILVNNESPEALDEFFWKVFLQNNYYSKEGLQVHELAEEQIILYKQYIELVAKAYGKTMYISKNNNSLLRLRSLIKANVYSKIVITFRDPLSHANSLLKLHKKFTKDQVEDPYVLQYFNFLGHHEFGKGHLPFLLKDEYLVQLKKYDPFAIEYWLLIWLNYYSYILEHFLGDILLVEFNDICTDAGSMVKAIGKTMGLDFNVDEQPAYLPPVYESSNVDQAILSDCEQVYHSLCKHRMHGS